MTSEKRFLPWFMWLLAAGFFFAEYFARVDPGIMVDYLMSSFKVGAAAVGGLSAYFYYPYVLMQIPVGILLDRHGPKRWLYIAAFVSSVGALTFGLAQSLCVIKLGRFLIGFGASFAFVGALKIANMWFDRSRLGLLSGLTQAAGMLGAAVGTFVFVPIVASLGWRATLYLIAAILLLFSILFFLFIKDKPDSMINDSVGVTSHESVSVSLRRVLKNPNSCFNALYAGFLYAPTAALGELWGVSFFHHLRCVTDEFAGLMVAAIFLGWTVGAPWVGYFTDLVGRRRQLMFLSPLLSMLILLIIIYIPSLTPSLMLVLLFFYGVSNTGVALAYALAGDLHPSKFAGISVAFTNMMSIMMGALFQPLMGWILDQQWTGTMSHGLRIYSRQDYVHTLTILPISLILAFIMVFFIKDPAPSSK